MRRTIRNLLGLTAATAVIAVGVPALTSSASATSFASATSAATLTAGSAASSDYDEYWGSYYSKYFNGSRAKARGHVWSDDSDRIHVQGKLYDKSSPSWLCGYAQVKFENEDGDENTRWARKCGSGGYQSFHFSAHDVDNVQVRVCYWDNHNAKKKSCGKWYYIYEVDGDE
jgi:hypothetical protein